MTEGERMIVLGLVQRCEVDAPGPARTFLFGRHTVRFGEALKAVDDGDQEAWAEKQVWDEHDLAFNAPE